LEGRLDVDEDAGSVLDWAQAHDDFQLVSASRALRGQATGGGGGISESVNLTDFGFLAPKVIDFIRSCASGGT